MRILIVGGGIGGMTLAALLAQRGVRPTVIERAPDFEHMGYMLGLYPLGSRVLHGLQLFQRFLDVSEKMAVYDMCNGKGEVVKRFEIGALVERFGPFQLVARADLVRLLVDGAHRLAGADGLDLRMGVALAGLDQTAEAVEVRFSDGTGGSYDLVVGADGMHSKTRELLFRKIPYGETGWGGWLWWAPEAAAPHEVATEYWGAGRFVGVYPTRGRIGVFAGGAIPPELRDAPEAGRRERLRAHFSALEGRIRPLLDSLPADGEDIFYWDLHDVRAPEWSKGRVVLLGDAACGFLPTAGIGASMAMESAAALNDELSRADAAGVPLALRLFEKRHRGRVEAAQANSRRLGKLMFVDSTPLAWGRDQLMKFVTLESLIREIGSALDQPI